MKPHMQVLVPFSIETWSSKPFTSASVSVYEKTNQPRNKATSKDVASILFNKVLCTFGFLAAILTRGIPSAFPVLPVKKTSMSDNHPPVFQNSALCAHSVSQDVALSNLASLTRLGYISARLSQLPLLHMRCDSG